jgi:hypothetical protein
VRGVVSFTQRDGSWDSFQALLSESFHSRSVHFRYLKVPFSPAHKSRKILQKHLENRPPISYFVSSQRVIILRIVQGASREARRHAHLVGLSPVERKPRRRHEIIAEHLGLAHMPPPTSTYGQTFPTARTLGVRGEPYVRSHRARAEEVEPGLATLPGPVCITHAAVDATSRCGPMLSLFIGQLFWSEMMSIQRLPSQGCFG